MSIDFSQVKTITIPEGSVKKITDSAGNILWKKQSAEWHTIWEGNKTITATKSGNDAPVISGVDENFAQTAVGIDYAPKIRITFSYSNTNTDPNWMTDFTVNALSTLTSVSSPLTIERVTNMFDNTRLCTINCKYTEKKAVRLDVGLWKKRDTNDKNRLTFQLKGASSNDITSYSGNFTLTFTITKIEQYY